MIILGISALYHDSAAAIIKDGKVIVALEEERFSRLKHDNNFPEKAIKKCLEIAKISPAQIDAIAYYEKPLLKFERILETFILTYPRSLLPFIKTLPEWLGKKIKVEETIRKYLNYHGKIFFIPHHLSHASSCFYSSRFKEAAILTIDGVGEYQTTGLWLGDETEIKPLKKIDFPHSLGLLYSTFTAFLGFTVNNDEYKMMGLAAYGRPIYVDKIYQLVQVKKDGSFQLNLDYFGFLDSFKMYNKLFEKLFGKSRKKEDPITQYHKDLAASIQKVTEEIYFKILNHLYQLTHCQDLCLSGGVALNSLANGKIYKNTPFKNVYIFGPAGDSGTAVGAALYTYHQIFNKKKRYSITHLYLGTEYNDDEIEKNLISLGLKYRKFDQKDELIKETAKLLSENKIIGWFQGRMEFGPRALGARSILANPYERRMKEWVNKIKKREQFRPFAASVLQEKVADLFEVPERNHFSPFMNFCFLVKKEWQKKIAAIVHADKTCRIQTVNYQDNGDYYLLIKEFYRLTGIPCLLNTSFNLKGEPIVETPEQAIEDFLKTSMDYLIIGKFLLAK